jgi:hypothetical protein
MFGRKVAVLTPGDAGCRVFSISIRVSRDLRSRLQTGRKRRLSDSEEAVVR